jgi:hypothetical protein
LGDKFWIGNCAGVDADFVGPSLKHGAHILHGPDSSSHGKRHEAFLGGAFDDSNHGFSAVGAGGNVKKNHFVCALGVIPQSEFHRIADIAQPAFFGSAELHAAGDFAVMDVETGNNALGKHECLENEAREGTLRSKFF